MRRVRLLSLAGALAVVAAGLVLASGPHAGQGRTPASPAVVPGSANTLAIMLTSQFTHVMPNPPRH